MKKLIALLLALAMVFGLAACSGGTNGTNTASNGTNDKPGNSANENNSASGAERSKTANLAVSENVLVLDPHRTANGIGRVVNRMIFDSLVESDFKGGYLPGLAESWEISDDGLVYTFHLREGVTFTNGEACDADDVELSFNRLKDNPDFPSYGLYWNRLESVEKVDAKTIKLHFNSSLATMLSGIASVSIIPNEAFAAEGEDLFYSQKMYGTGKWKFDEWVDGQYLHVVKNENSWEGNDSYFDDVYIRFVLEGSTAVNAHVTGDVDAYIASGGISVDFLPMYAGTEDKIEIRSIPSSMIDYIQFQCEDGSVFQDPDVRRAFNMAIDRQTIIDAVFGGGSATEGIMNETMLGYDPNFHSKYYEYDPEAAKALLESSSYNGEPIVISTNSGMINAEAMLLAISDNVNAIGFNTSIQVVEAATFMEMRTTGQYDVFVVSIINSTGDPFLFTQQRVMQDIHKHHYVNDEMFDLIAEGATNPDRAARQEAYAKANEIIAEECAPVAGLLMLNLNEAITYGITGVDVYADGDWNFKNVSWDPSLVK